MFSYSIKSILLLILHISSIVSIHRSLKVSVAAHSSVSSKGSLSITNGPFADSANSCSNSSKVYSSDFFIPVRFSFKYYKYTKLSYTPRLTPAINSTKIFLSVPRGTSRYIKVIARRTEVRRGNLTPALFHVEQPQNSPSMLEGVPGGGGSQSLSQNLHTPPSLAARVPPSLTIEEEFFTSFLKTFHHTTL